MSTIDSPNTFSTKNLIEAARQLIHAKKGPLTRELLRQPGRFGLGQLPVDVVPDKTTTAVCGFCSTGCGLNILLRDNESVGLAPSTDYPVNLGMACPKGWEALSVLDAEDRATTPLLKQDNGKLEAVDWDTALTAMVKRFKQIQAKHGLGSVAFLSTGQIATEEMALLGSVAKFGMGMLHGDGNTRQCMATAATAYKQSFGFDAPPFTYADFEESDCLIFVGANPCIAHPIMWERVMRNKNQPNIIVVDPRHTETASSATMHLPIRPKSDQALFYGLSRILIERGAIDREFIDHHTDGFSGYEEFVSSYTPEFVCKETGLSESQFMEFAETVMSSERVSMWWTMGVNQSYQGTRTAQSLINLCLMTRSIGRPGTGPNSITGQCNAMGSRLFSNTTSLLGGHNFLNEQHRERIADLLDIPVDRIPDSNSLAYNEIIDGIDSGEIRGLWVIATNPAHSWIEQGRLEGILDKLDFLVVQDMYDSTETAQVADLVLPAAAWGEKEGTFINSERRIGLLKKVHKAPGVALPDFDIFRLVAEYYGCGSMFNEWESPEAAFRILQRISAGTPCDITGINDYRHIDDAGGIQWPFPEGTEETATERRLFSDGGFFTDNQRAKFLYETEKPMPEPVDEAYPIVLLTGRGTASQWHTQTRTAKSAVLRKLYPANNYVEIHPDDAAELGIAPGSMTKIASRRGTIQAKAVITPNVQRGHVFVPMHYDQTNQLTLSTFDPYSKQPSYKACAVKLSPATWG
ncbi:molybdopterin oxidoreductase family protein [Calycomorphotria hydatis]|uniref:Nitrate reductase n=1 Tax=Calycomorphotria hydatis TaxID=2528027 RepID=A0A517T9Z2_9PLAN|nr:nitrate reductase [Calycomorphotria hydatis]QDT65194.1 Nitrate reductase [Calycomorphotria hydatis]